MYLLWPHTYESLDNSLELFAANLDKLKAAQIVDINDVIDQVRRATDASRNLRSLVIAAQPGAVWQNREEFDKIVARIQRVSADRSRILELATELERGAVVHRRTLRIDQTNLLREHAVMELRSTADLQGEPPVLPGPAAERWIEWACDLKEPDDAEALRTLRDRFTHLDNFIANLDTDMWVSGTKAAA
jgi:hypothetical protein